MIEESMCEETRDEHNYEEFFKAKMNSMFGTENLDDLSGEQREFFSAVEEDWQAVTRLKRVQGPQLKTHTLR